MSCANTAKVATGRLWHKGAAKSLSMCRRCSKWRASIWPFIATDSLNDLGPQSVLAPYYHASVWNDSELVKGAWLIFSWIWKPSHLKLCCQGNSTHINYQPGRDPGCLKPCSDEQADQPCELMRIKHLGAKATSLHATPEGKDKHKEMRTKTTIKNKYEQPPTNTNKTNMNNNQQTKTTCINKKYHHGLPPHFLWSDNFIPAFSRFSYQGAMRTGRTYRAWWTPESAPEFPLPILWWNGLDATCRWGLYSGHFSQRISGQSFPWQHVTFDVEAYDF